MGSEFAKSQNPHMRKGGLIGLAAMAIGLGKIKLRFFLENFQAILYLIIYENIIRNCLFYVENRTVVKNFFHSPFFPQQKSIGHV